MMTPSFTRVCVGTLVNDWGNGQMNTFLTVGDVDGDGRLDIVLSGRNGRMVWFQNPGPGGASRWEAHPVADIQNLECGGLLYDLTGSGLPDIIDGGDWRSDALCWWENPGRLGRPWTRHRIVQTGHTQFHDEAIGDVTGDGRPSLVFWNEGAATLSWCPLPADPRRSPWPGVQPIATDRRVDGLPEEGLALADLDGDGVTEIIAGTRWYKHLGPPNEWESHAFAPDGPGGYVTTVIAVGDLNGDGRPEIVLSEGDPCIYGRPEGGRVAWFAPGGDIRAPWLEHILEERLLDPHSLQLGDLSGEGWLDLVVGEIGVKDRLDTAPPRLLLFQNDGQGRFTRHVIDEGFGTHHARLADIRGRGVLDVVSRPLHGPDKWNVYVWYNNRADR